MILTVLRPVQPARLSVLNSLFYNIEDRALRGKFVNYIKHQFRSESIQQDRRILKPQECSFITKSDWKYRAISIDTFSLTRGRHEKAFRR